YEDNTIDAAHEDDSKVGLQRVLEIRKAVLQREQTMVYTRALVAGFETHNLADLVCFDDASGSLRLSCFFETDNLADLVHFADAFGSPRLRYGRLFNLNHTQKIELCNTKSNDTGWMDEVAAMQAYSRSQYDYMERSCGISEYDHGKEFKINVKQQNGSVDGATDSSTSLGRNLPWPPNMEESKHRGKLSHMEGSQDDNFDSSDSSSENDSRSDDLVTSVENKHEEKTITQQRNIFLNLLIKDANENDSKKVTKRSNDWDYLNGNKNRVGNLRSTDDETMEAWNPDMESESSYQKIVKLDFVADDKSTMSRTKTLVSKGLDRKGTTIYIGG
nr:hypothetical protein [Tanacetum cinerariifolium]